MKRWIGFLVRCCLAAGHGFDCLKLGLKFMVVRSQLYHMQYDGLSMY